MVRIIEERIMTEDGLKYAELAGLKDDTKPTGGLVTGSLFLEVDTGDVYAYDEEAVSPAEPWGKIAALGGGS